MTRRSSLTAVAAASLAAVLALSGCGSAVGASGPISVAGTTRVDLVTVSAPAPSDPVVDVTVGIAKLQTPQLIAQRRRQAQAAKAAAASLMTPRPAGVLARVEVRPGDRVKKGQVVAVMDDAALRLGVALAEAGYRRSVAQSELMAANADELRDQRSQVYDARATLASQESMLSGQKDRLTGQAAAMEAQLPKLRAAQAGLRSARSGLGAQLAQAEKAAQSPTPPPGIQQVIAKLKGAIAKVDAQTVQVSGALSGIEAALPKMRSGLAQMRTGLGKMDAAKGQIRTALSKMADGIDQLEQTSDVLSIAARAQSAGVDIAKLTLADAVLRSPVAGTVVSAQPAGQLAMVGAPVVTIRPDRDVAVDIYLAPEQAARVKAGDRATVTLDSIKEPLKGAVATVWPSAEFPPNAYPTPIVHLTTVERVTVTVPDKTLPLGVPVDVVISPSK